MRKSAPSNAKQTSKTNSLDTKHLRRASKMNLPRWKKMLPLAATLSLFATASAACLPTLVLAEGPLVGCLKELPPVDRPIQAVSLDAGCSGALLCLDIEGQLALEHNVLAWHRFGHEAVTRCYVTEDGGFIPNSDGGTP